MPDPVPAQATAPETPPTLEQRMETATATTPEGAPAPTLATVANPAQPGAAPEPGHGSAEWQGVRDYAQSQGIELPQAWADDAAALQNLLQGYRQLQERNYYADLGRQFSQIPVERLRELAQPPPQAQKPPPWQPPPWQDEWAQMVEADPETGVLRAKPGYDPSLPEKVRAYADWRNKFLQAPDQVLGPLVEERARAIVREEQAQYQQQTLAQDLVSRDAGWMFTQGQQGRQLTPAGALYRDVAARLWEGGLRDVRAVHAMSRAAVENAVLRQQVQATQGGGQAPAAPALAPATTPVSRGGRATRPAPSAPPVPLASQKGMSLRERLAVTLKNVPDDTGFGAVG